MSGERIFGPTPEAKRRGVLFGLSLTTALICLIAATSTYLGAGANTMVVLGLAIGSVVFVVFAVLLYGGHLGGLFTDDQLFWRVMELER
jgi:hypothetical protein